MNQICSLKRNGRVTCENFGTQTKLDDARGDDQLEISTAVNVQAFCSVDLESICVEDEEFKDKETTTGISKHNPFSVSISLSLVEAPMLH